MPDSAVVFDSELVNRYGVEGPRYTSYPTALQFREGLDADAYDLAVASSAAALAGHPLSLYVHIPFCSSPCFYCGCNKVVTRRPDQIQAYVRHLLAEIALRAPIFKRARVIEQMHFGGGTPSYLPQRDLIEIIHSLDGRFGLTRDPGRDYSLEIDPRGIDRDAIRVLATLGFNRISLGVQDFDPKVQQAINRVQPEDTVIRAFEAARQAGFGSINVDLIYGLPRQTRSSFARTLKRTLALRPDRIAVYGYAHMPAAFKAQRQIRAADLPDRGERLALLQLTVETLCSSGYDYIGMDHFALPSDSLAVAARNGTLHRSFQGYTTHADRDLVNLGVSAIGRVGNLYIQNHKTLKAYGEALERGRLPVHRGVHMTQDDLIRGAVIQQIMCRSALEFETIEDRFGIRFAEYFGSELAKLESLAADGLIEQSPGGMSLTAAGRLLMRNVAMVFDAYLRSPGSPPRMSSAI